MVIIICTAPMVEAMVFRLPPFKNIYGPYEEKIVLRDTTKGINFGIHQGALIQTQTGEWWTILFVDRGPLGRFPSLQPVTWVDNWPMVGVNGKAVVTYKKPNVGKKFPIKDLPDSDELIKQNWECSGDGTTTLILLIGH